MNKIYRNFKEVKDSNEERDLIKHPMKRNGFTLIELVIIIAILGILVAILLPLLQKMNWLKEKVVTGPINFYLEEKSYSDRVGMELKLKDPQKQQKVAIGKLKAKVEKAVSLAVKEALEVKTEEEGPPSLAKPEKPG